MELVEESTLAGLLRRPDLEVAAVAPFLAEGVDAGARADVRRLDAEGLERVAAELRYEGFLRRERETIARLARSEGRPIPTDFVYRGLPGLSLEAAEKLERHRPRTLGQAGRIPGVTPAAAALLLARLLVLARARGEAA